MQTSHILGGRGTGHKVMGSQNIEKDWFGCDLCESSSCLSFSTIAFESSMVDWWNSNFHFPGIKEGHTLFLWVNSLR